MKKDPPAKAPVSSPLHLPCLATALIIMLVGTLYPAIMTDRLGHPDHRLAGLLLYAMSAGFVRGLGFIPSHLLWRWTFSGWACLLALTGAAVLRLGS
ncbi:MAG: hypothetical protein EKK45_12010 [Curvibacter sp.]|nr:MAG: hypothetical protein EKK45_12010 [Curvibacter sp.]